MLVNKFFVPRFEFLNLSAMFWRNDCMVFWIRSISLGIRVVGWPSPRTTGTTCNDGGSEEHDRRPLRRHTSDELYPLLNPSKVRLAPRHFIKDDSFRAPWSLELSLWMLWVNLYRRHGKLNPISRMSQTSTNADVHIESVVVYTSRFQHSCMCRWRYFYRLSQFVSLFKILSSSKHRIKKTRELASGILTANIRHYHPWRRKYSSAIIINRSAIEIKEGHYLFFKTT